METSYRIEEGGKEQKEISPQMEGLATAVGRWLPSASAMCL
jgi:hypothetical protein